MAYVTVKNQTATELSLLREPSFLSKAVFVGFFIGILGIFLFGSESLFFKILIGAGAACLSCLIVDNYEICDFDKDKSQVRMTRMHWFQHYLNQFNLLPAQPYVTANLKDIKDVRVEEQEGGKAYQVVLSLDSGISLGVTEVFTTDDISVHEKVAKQIKNFLGGLPPLKADDEADDECEEEEEGEAGQASSSGSEDDFEQISRADLDDMEEEIQGDVAQSQAAPGEREGAGDVSATPGAETEGADTAEVKTAPVS